MDELAPLPNHLLSGAILRMRLAGDDQLHRALGVAKNSRQAIGIVE